jgi:hypothetical protein
MERSFELDVRDRLTGYLASEYSIGDFKSWLVASTWSLDQAHPSPGLRFANEIKLLFAEHSGGFRSDEELRDDLVRLLRRIESDVALTT